MKKQEMNVPIMIGAVLVVLGFFFGWFGSSRHAATGWDVAGVVKRAGGVYYLIYLLPVGALLAAVVSLVNRKAGATMGIIVGGGFTGWAAFEMVRFLYTVTCGGLWITVSGCLVLLIGGLLTRPKSS